MKNQKLIVTLLTAFAVFFCTVAFVSTDRQIFYKPTVFKKAVSIAPTTTAIPDTCAFLQLGDVTGSKYGSLLLYSTDTTTVGMRKKRGLIIFNSADTSLWIYTGQRWKKAGS